MEWVGCDLCGGNNLEALYSIPDRLSPTKELFRIVRCRSCSLVFVNPRPTEKEIINYYPPDYSSYQPISQMRRRIKHLFLRRELRRWKWILSPNARMIDVGAGMGEDAAFLQGHGNFTIEAIDTSAFAAQQARKYFGLTIGIGTLESFRLPEASYDLVRMRYVLSHVYSPRRVLAEAHRILKPGGRLALWIPNIESLDYKIFGRYWEGQEAPRHLFELSERTLRRYLEDSGFSIERVSHSIVPNTFIHSARNLLAERGAPRILTRLFTLNPLVVLCFLPLSFISALLRQSDRIMVIAQKL